MINVITDPLLRKKPPNTLKGTMKEGTRDNARLISFVLVDSKYPINNTHKSTSNDQVLTCISKEVRQ